MFGNRKRKKSGAENKKASKAKKEENVRLGSFMINYFATASETSTKNDTSIRDHELDHEVEVAGADKPNINKEVSGEDPAHPTTDSACDHDKNNKGEGLEESSASSEETPSDCDSSAHEGVMDELNDDSSVSACKDIFTDIEAGRKVLKETLDTTAPIALNPGEEDDIAIKHALPRNPALIIDEENATFDPASLVNAKLSMEDKEKFIKMNPCQPPECVLSVRKKEIGKRNRYCSQGVFFREGQTKRKWLSYSLSKDCLYCIPCLLFSDECLRGENMRFNQGNAFTNAGYSNWKKQYSGITKHETSESHVNAKIAQVVFLQGRSISNCLEQQEKDDNLSRKKKVNANRNVMKRIVDTVVFLGKQGLAFRGHRESLDPAEANKGNFLEALDYLSTYDVTIDNHLEKVRKQQISSKIRNSGKIGAKGRGSKLTFLSNDTQNNVINIIGKEISSEIVKEISNCRAWALIADTTPDIRHHEQLSICVRIVNAIGKCSEHLLSCKRASGTTALELYDLITATLASKSVSFEKLVAQTYDGASNMSGCYNGLQALFKEKVGDHVVFVHCYAHTLNLVLSDSASIAVQVISLFNNLEALYVLFSKSQRIHGLFEAAQLEENLKVFSLKRLNTVRWNSREFCLKVVLSRYECILTVLETVSTDISFEGNPRNTAAGLLTQLQTKQFLATAYLFREIFAVTGPLSRYLQSVNVDFGKALDMVNSAVGQLNKMRDEPERIITCVEQEHDSESVVWQQTRYRRRRRMDGENAEDEPAETPKDHWKRATFYVAVDTVLNSMKNRFEKNQPLLKAFSLFSPNRFPELLQNFKTAHDLQASLNIFCETYNLDVFRCADELFNFARSFKRLNCTAAAGGEEEDDDMSHMTPDVSDRSDGEGSDSDANDGTKKKTTKNIPSFTEALEVLCHPEYSLVDAYPTLCQVYAIAVAIPVSSSTAERSFSALKRVKTRIRSSMVQERLESLLSMAIERNILLSLDKERLVNLYAGISPELSKALL